jgi:hypothetical protein
LMCPTKFGHGLRQNVHDSRFTTSSSSNKHEPVPYKLRDVWRDEFGDKWLVARCLL